MHSLLKYIIICFRYNPRDSSMNSHTYRYKRGANQQFCQATHIFDPSKYTEEDLLFNSEKDMLPIAIHCVVEEGIDGITFPKTKYITQSTIFSATKLFKIFFVFLRCASVAYYNSCGGEAFRWDVCIKSPQTETVR